MAVKKIWRLRRKWRDKIIWENNNMKGKWGRSKKIVGLEDIIRILSKSVRLVRFEQITRICWSQKVKFSQNLFYFIYIVKKKRLKENFAFFSMRKDCWNHFHDLSDFQYTINFFVEFLWKKYEIFWRVKNDREINTLHKMNSWSFICMI